MSVAIGYLLRVGIICFIYTVAKRFALKSKCSEQKAYRWAVGSSALVAAISCLDRGSVAGSITEAIAIFSVLVMTTVAGTYKGLQDRATRKK